MSIWPLPIAAIDDWITLIVLVVFFIGPVVLQIIKKLKGQPEEEARPASPRGRPPQRPAPGSPPPRQYTADAEEIRKFLEALGKPRTAPPPPPPPQRTAPPPLLRPAPSPQRRPPAVPRPKVEPATQGPPPPSESPYAIRGESQPEYKPIERVDFAKEMKAVEAEVARSLQVERPVVAVATSYRAFQFRKKLAERDNVRQAIVLAELLGAPKALRQTSATSSALSLL